jgi:hypothetical protein
MKCPPEVYSCFHNYYLITGLKWGDALYIYLYKASLEHDSKEVWEVVGNLTDILIAENIFSVPLTSKPAIGHDPELLPVTSLHL